MNAAPVFVGGPLAGRDLPDRISRHLREWPEIQCYRPAGGAWHHYRHAGDGRYRHAGLCLDNIHEEGWAPWDNQRCEP